MFSAAREREELAFPPRERPVGGRCRDRLAPGEIVRRERPAGKQSLEIPLIHQPAAFPPRARTKIDDVIRRAHHLLVMLDDHHGVGPVAQALQRRDQALVVARMQADRRLVQHIQHARESAADLRREADALHLAAGERGAWTVQREIVEPDIVQKLQPLDDLLVDVLHLRRKGQAAKMRKAVLDAHRHHVHDRPARHRHGTRFRLQAGTMAGRALPFALVNLKLLAMFVVFRLVQTALERGQHALEGPVHAAPRQDQVVIEAVHQLFPERRRELLVRGRELHLVLLRDLLKQRIVVHDGVVAGAPPRMDALAQRQGPVGHHKIFVEIVDGAEPSAGRARAEGGIERERAWLQLVKGDAAVFAGVQLREYELPLPQNLNVDDAAPGLQPQLDGVGETRTVAGQHDAIHDHIDVVALLLVEFRSLLYRTHCPVDPHAREALAFDLGKRLLMAPLLALHHWRIEDQLDRRPGVGRLELQHRLHDLLGGLPNNLAPALRAVRHTNAPVKQPKIVVNLRDRRDDGTRIPARRALLDGDGRRKAFDLLHVRLLHLVKELPGIGAERLHIAALPLGIERVERERTFPAARKPRHDRKRIARNRDVDVLEVVLLRTVDLYVAHVNPSPP